MKTILLFLAAASCVAANPLVLLSGNAPNGGAGPDVTAPTLTSASVNGTALTLNWSEAVTGTGAYLAALDVDLSTTGSNITMTHASGNGTATWVMTLASPAVTGETANFDFSGGSNLIEDAAGNDLAAITDGAVTNATVDASPLPPASSVIAWWAMERNANEDNMVDSKSSIVMTQAGNPPRDSGKVGTYSGGLRATGEKSFSMTDAAAASAGFEFGDTSFAIALWYRPLTNVSYGGLFGKFSSASGNYSYTLNTVSGAPRLSMSSNGTAVVDALSGVTMSTATWYFIYADYNASTDTMRISVNNGTPVTTSQSGGVFNSNQDLKVGSLGSSNFSDGSIDELAIFNRTLTSTEITAIYNAGAGVTYSSLP